MVENKMIVGEMKTLKEKIWNEFRGSVKVGQLSGKYKSVEYGGLGGHNEEVKITYEKEEFGHNEQEERVRAKLRNGVVHRISEDCVGYAKINRKREEGNTGRS